MAGSQEAYKNRNDPGRFFGDGVIFKAKLIGILEVGEARGDRMCQEALQDLKTAIRAAGEHKQRITINVTIDGLRLRDERTGDSLYHHPVHKISFIAQDMTDSRAFGYIFGSPESGHRFFGIKTDKAASQVVLAMRDLFQVVFELKKKEIELARQHIQSKSIHDHQPVTLNIKSTLESSHSTYNKDHSETSATSKYTHKEMSPESVADLVDLEQELSSIQRGITQMERITPIEPPTKNLNEDDPFGDSFTQYPTYNLLPPPESTKSRYAKQLKPPDDNYASTAVISSSTDNSNKIKAKSTADENWLNSSDVMKLGKTNQTSDNENRNGLKLSTSVTSVNDIVATDDNLMQTTPTALTATSSASHYIDAFSDLDPLGTGKIRPYIDKKYFFQDLKNPPKKVLKDLSDRDGFSTSFISEPKSTSDFSVFQEKSNIDNALQDSRKKSEQSDEFVAQFSSNTQIFSPNNNGTHGTPPNLSRSDNVPPYSNQGSSFPGPFDNNSNANKVNDSADPFSPRVRKFDPFEDEFSKPSSTFDFSFSKAFSESNKATKHQLFNGPLQDVRRLQESDSYSENEIVPEPPPRPETNLHSEPPPLPPKKQFSDIVIRPRVTSPLAMGRDSSRYGVPKSNHVSHDQQQSGDAPSLPLPSRRIGRAESNQSYPGPGRPEKEVPLLLPPPKTKGSIKNRSRRSEENVPNATSDGNRKSAGKSDSENVNTSAPIVKSIPDITLSQLLTLGIDDLASKLNVPASKLNTMTIVELTKYLSDYIEKSSQKNFNVSDPPPSVPASAKSTTTATVTSTSQPETSATAPPLEKASESSAVFKVSFDDSSDSTFIAKFDDNFGIDNDFIPNFDQFNQTRGSTVDKYAVFREIIDQEMQSDHVKPDTKQSNESNEVSSDAESPTNDVENLPLSSKIDTKITEAISQAKDRYAALRDIILVEDLFEKPSSVETPIEDRPTENVDNSLNDDIEKEFDVTEQSSPEANISITLDDQEDLDPLKTLTTPTISQPILSSKDDLEIDEYMNRAISNLSLDSRDHLSPLSKSGTKSQNASTSPLSLQYKKSSPIEGISEEPGEELNIRKTTLNDMSTSPIPIHSSPIIKTATSESFSVSKSPISLLNNDSQPNQAIIATPSPVSKNDPAKDIASNGNQAPVQEESWAVFDTEKVAPAEITNTKSPREESAKMVAESPCSSDDKADWKTDNKKWRGHTSSSSRDLSPWDDDEYRSHRSLSSHPDRHGFYMRHARRMNSCDDEYEYEDEKARRRDRRNNGSQNWYHPSNHRSWSPPEDENCDHGRSFDRCSYERSTYGPPYEKRDLKSMPYSSDRHLYKGYDKRKYMRDYGRPYDMDDYGSYEQQMKHSRKGYVDEVYENTSNFSMRSKVPKDYFYEREKHSFDRDSTESFESNGRRRKSFGSGGDMCGGFNYRERYSSADRKRSMRKSNKNQRSNEEDYEQDSDGDAAIHRLPPTETRSLQRRPRKSSGSSPWDGEDHIPTAGQRSWKRPASASESERKLAERSRLNPAVSGSDGEKDRRFFRKPRSRDREADMRSNYATMRYPSASRGDDYEYDGADYDEEEEEQFHDMRRKDRHTADYRRRIEHSRNMESMHRMSRSNRDVCYQSEKDRYDKFDSFDQGSKGGGSRSSSRREHDFSYEDTPHPNVGTTKFDFEAPDNGFESDFNTAPEKSLRFSTDFSVDKTSSRLNQNTHSIPIQSTGGNSEMISTPPQQKLRFDDKITVSKFDLFEDDDFSKAEFSFQNEDQWVEELPKKNNLKNVTSMKRHDNIKKSESVNIFARNQDDPFEDDDFFNKSSEQNNNNNFAKFEDNL
ncbi:protein disabled isoform X6 [Sitodiplosis mosellana]|uniref:protein disabled isoform X6 n=1 Tax=Sitodiplosis mosellana TaxID=263140 RepID=UPI002444BA9C|nr:protein disabled isoform X6 [Sitodiplosis mosellana]XP_055322686.1 protein disabled isoform X6 [Sitodiplosis mosellana]